MDDCRMLGISAITFSNMIRNISSKLRLSGLLYLIKRKLTLGGTWIQNIRTDKMWIIISKGVLMDLSLANFILTKYTLQTTWQCQTGMKKWRLLTKSVSWKATTITKHINCCSIDSACEFILYFIDVKRFALFVIDVVILRPKAVIKTLRNN